MSRQAWTVGVALVAAGLLAGVPARADAGRLGLGLQAVVKGRELPAIVVRPQAAVKSLRVTLTRADGQAQTLEAGRIAAGATRKLSIKQPTGVFEYTADFAVRWADGSDTSFQTTFKATRVGELTLDIGAGDVDLAARRMTFRLTNPAEKAELILLGERGRRLGVFEQAYDGEAPGTPLELAWDEVEGEVLRMDLKVWDIAGFWAGMQITPIHIEIPHDDVEFETGEHVIREQEAPKLEATLKLVHEALEKHGTLLALKLYVAGYTDTVGSRASNQELSTRRARSIGQWFKAHGLKVPVYYQGFGEDVLARPTPDETPEAANRRAVYILSSQDPTGQGVPRSAWKRL